MKNTILRLAAAAALVLALAAPVANAAVGPDYVASDNVTLLTRLKEVGTGVGATIVGNYMYVTSTHGLFIYDIKTDPANPKLVSNAVIDIQFENEEVPTNGKILGISSDTFCIYGDPAGLSHSGSGCLAIYDVSDPTNVHLDSVLDNAGDHTSACLLDCTWMYGSTGSIDDLRDPKNPKLLDTPWTDVIAEQGWSQQSSCHHVREIQPGIILGSCQPIVLMSVRPEDGGSPEHPILLAQGVNEDGRFIHSSRWPRKGTDKFVLVGGEKNATPQCSDAGTSAFMTWDGSKVEDGKGGFVKGSEMTEIDEVKPINGTYTDGHTPYNVLGCSVHWFEEHPTFHNGGLVALAEYENGTRFEQITPEGKIKEQGFFLPAGGSTSAPHWNQFDPTIVYAVDYARGVDVLKWTGDTYVPNGNGDVVPTPGATPGTNGQQPPAGAACASAAGFKSAKAAGKGNKVAFNVKVRQKKPFSVEVFQQSQGSKVIGNRLVAKFSGKKKSFTWNGKDRKGRRLSDGNYFVRFTMKTSSGIRDQRRATLTRKGGRFSAAPDFYQRVDCGYFKALKLTSSVFGGRTNAKLGVSYTPSVSVKSVTVEFKAGSKTLKAIDGGGVANTKYRYSVPASIAKKGTLVKVVITPQTANGAAPAITLAAKRI